MAETPIDPRIEAALQGLPDDFRSFGRVFENEIRPALLAREGDRIRAADKARKGRMAGLALGAAVAIVGGLLTRHPMAIFAAAAAGFGYWQWQSADLRRIGAEAKQLIVEPIAKNFMLAFTPDPGEIDTISRHHELGLVPSWDRSSFEDLVSGERHGVSFELFEAMLEERRTTRDSQGRTQTNWVTVFRGQCLKFAFPKRFYGRTLVTRDAGIFNRFGGGGGMQRAGLEDPQFEKIFEVYTTDQVESRFLLTPDLMQKLVDMERIFHGGNIKCCFDQGECLITLEGGDLFEPGSMFTPLDNPERIRELLDDFAAIFHIIDQVTANRRREQEARGT
jgi:hypothetical protein